MYRRQFLKLSAAAVVSARATTAAAPNADLPLPEWAQTGNFVHMGLDGGPLEAEKGAS